MSTVNEAIARRMTLGHLADQYGLELDPPFCGGVTITSIADDVDSVRPGALYVPAQSVDVKRLAEARDRGAYAALVPPTMRAGAGKPELPLLRARLTPMQLGRIASDIAGTPSNSLAVFVVSTDDPERVEPYVNYAAEFLHMLGNPVGVIKSEGSKSLERELDVHYPMSILDVQQTLSVCVEDGAAAVVIALDDRTLQPDALASVNVDVIGMDSTHILPEDQRSYVDGLAERFGFIVDEQTHLTTSDSESDLLAAQAAFAHDRESIRELSLAIAMVMAAGVRKSNIRNALRVSHELTHGSQYEAHVRHYEDESVRNAHSDQSEHSDQRDQPGHSAQPGHSNPEDADDAQSAHQLSSAQSSPGAQTQQSTQTPQSTQASQSTPLPQNNAPRPPHDSLPPHDSFPYHAVADMHNSGEEHSSSYATNSDSSGTTDHDGHDNVDAHKEDQQV